ncbi:MAG: von Willebrand factor type A domain-containing protein, partial [Lentisphaeria bacterium]|nr:von Willebrand factor type A domain-containing protein [Lentisphaeria bacterium]
MRFVWATAAAVAVCCGLVIAYQQEQTQETQRTGITLTKDMPESVQTIESKQEKTVAFAEIAVVEDGASEHSLPPEPVVMQYSPPAMGRAVMATGFRGEVKAKARVGMKSPAYYSVSDRIPAPSVNFNTEEYKSLTENGFTATTVSPLSTFGADVDTATYTNVRRFLLQQNTLPPKDAVRTEEFLNYFTYNYKAPQGDADFHVNFESM